MRMHMRRFTRLTNAFSKRVENHAAAIALHTMYYNFVRIHQTLKVSPAMAAGVTDKLWEMDDLVSMLEQWELANFKPEYQFIVRQYMIGKGHSVSVMWRGGEVDTIFGFEKEADALAGIKDKSRVLTKDFISGPFFKLPDKPPLTPRNKEGTLFRICSCVG